MCLAPDDIAGHCGPNGKGLKRKLYYALPSQITSIPAPTPETIKVETDIVMADTNVFKSINIGRTNQNFDGTAAGDGDGTTLEYKIQFFVPKMDGDKGSALNKVLNGEYVFIVPDKNGVNHIIGALDDGAQLQINQQSDPNGYLCTIVWDSSHLAYVYTGVIPI